MMAFRQICDFDDAYANGIYIPFGTQWPARWIHAAKSFRAEHAVQSLIEEHRYGARPRNQLDLLRPAGPIQGLVIFIHGGYWLEMEKESFSHLARGPLAHGQAVALPSYSLCPDQRIVEIGKEIAQSIELAASLVDGPIRLVGHSAGGQLAARMVATGSPLEEKIKARISHVMVVSGLNDLRPLLRSAYRDLLQLDEKEAQQESPALLTPIPSTRLTCWVGAEERPEFIRQNSFLASSWYGLGASVAQIEVPGLHHFNIFDDLADPHSAMIEHLLS